MRDNFPQNKRERLQNNKKKIELSGCDEVDSCDPTKVLKTVSNRSYI